MGRHKNYDETIEIIQRYIKGDKVSTIAKDFGVVPSTIYRLINRHGVKEWENVHKGRTYNRLTEPDKHKLVDLYRSGTTVEQIASKIRCSIPTVYSHIKKAGLMENTVVNQYALDTAIEMHSSKLYTIQEILERTGLKKTTFYRALNQHKLNQEG